MSNRLSFKDFIEEKHRRGLIATFPTGMGTGLQELGEALDPPYKLSMPLWANGALEDEVGRRLIRQVHEGAVLVGKADVITTATWMRRTAFEGIRDNWEAVANEVFSRGVRLSVEIRDELEVKTGREIYVGGSFGPILDSHNWKPDEVISKDYLFRTHATTAQILKAASSKLDFLIPETACRSIEALAMSYAASSTGMDFIIGLTPGVDGKFRDGVPLRDTVAEISSLNGFTAVAINCVGVDKGEEHLVDHALTELRRDYDGPVIVYANGFGPPKNDNVGWHIRHDKEFVDAFVNLNLRMSKKHSICGFAGCCGTTHERYGKAIGDAIETENAVRRSRFCEAVPSQLNVG